jgi:Ni/Fe-hydrogenase 1 B-type cytochrome subunit
MNLQAKEKRHPLSFRILHELIMASIIILIITGFYIHRPFVGGGGFLMAMVLGMHFFFAAILIIATVVRVIGMFVGKDRDWRSFIPTGSDIKLLPRIINYYAYLSDEPVLKKKYNPLQMFSYCLAFVVTWLFIMFLMIHVYLTIREKFQEIKEMHLLSGDEKEEAAKE